MFKNLLNGMANRSRGEISKDEVAELLKVNPKLLDEFENSYKPTLDEVDDNFFKVNAKQATKDNKENKITELDEEVNAIVDKIVEELLVDSGIINKEIEYLKTQDLYRLPEEVRPQLAGNLVKKQINQQSYPLILAHYKRWQDKDDIESYHRFRQGLDILDLDLIVYEIIGMNKNSMGYWLGELEQAIDNMGFFKYPKTKIVKVPLPLLQLTRLDYSEHTPTTIKILNEFCMKAFDLDVNKKYFIKTGTYSSKFDFRNALVEGEQEVRELGEYLLFIHYQALQMASYLSQPSIYGVSTTNEWVVREFIEDVENNPTIYKGMPLHTEYRFFVDLGTKEVMGVSPYWREDVMKRSFNEGEQDSHKKHDYVIYKMYEDVLYERYNKNVGKLTEKVEELIQNLHLDRGQWSLDVMQNGDDFYVIDMSLASDSALSDVVDPVKFKKIPENWLPKLPDKK